MKRKPPTKFLLLEHIPAGPASRRLSARASVVRKSRRRRWGTGPAQSAYALHIVGAGRDALKGATIHSRGKRGMFDFRDARSARHPVQSEETVAERERHAARSMEKLRDTLLSVVSHELRSPLSGIQSWAHVLKHSLQGDDGRSAMSPQAGRALAGISASVQRQVAVVDSLIDSARILSGDAGLQYAVFRLGDAVEQALLEAADDIGAKRLKVTREVLAPLPPCHDGAILSLAEPSVPSAAVAVASFAAADAPAEGEEQGLPPQDWQAVAGDFERVKQVVAHLLSNAVKFNHPGGEISLTIDATPAFVDNWGEEGPSESDYGGHSAHDSAADLPLVRLTVEDTGIGIAPDVLPNIFLRFRQADQAYTRRNDGFGLGLAVARELVCLHGGQLQAASAGESRGARFTVILPGLGGTGPGATTPLSGERGFPSLAGLSIMIVDDQLEVRESLSAVFEQSGAQVMPAASGRDALAQLEARGPSREPDVLICDIAMPDEDGYTTLLRIREWEDDNGVLPKERMAAIAVTAFAQHEDRDRALSRGYALHFAKPVDPDRLLGAVVALSAGRVHDSTM